MECITELSVLKKFENDSRGSVVVLYFTTTWCAQCKVFGPLLETIQTKYPFARFRKVEMDADSISGDEIGSEYAVVKFPTVVIRAESGEPVMRMEGRADVTAVERVLKTFLV